METLLTKGQEKMLVTRIYFFSLNIFKNHVPMGLLKPGLLRLRVNPFPHDKILHQNKLKAFAGDKSNKNDHFCL